MSPLFCHKTASGIEKFSQFLYCDKVILVFILSCVFSDFALDLYVFDLGPQ